MHIKIWLTAALQIILLYKFGHQWVMTFFIYTSIRPLDPVWDNLWFDRINVLTLDIPNWNGKGHKRSNVAIGVWIAPDRLLTSYNPFRSIVTNKTESAKLNGIAITGRIRQEDWLAATFEEHRVVCGRPLLYIPDEQLEEDKLWDESGYTEKNSPLHDLMVLRINFSLTISRFASQNYTMALYPDNKFIKLEANAFLTSVANQSDYMGADFQYVENKEIAYVARTRLELHEFSADDDAVVDCDEWLKRDWGYFICIRNKYKQTSIESGAMLVSEEKVFGIFSFLLFRETESICVFTDVRPYYDHILKTCTKDDEIT